MKSFFVFVCLSFSIGLCAQHEFFFDVFNDTDDSQIEEYFDTFVLDNGAHYDLEVTGSYSIWNSSEWSSFCGDADSEPLFPSENAQSTGSVGFDFLYLYALPIFRCAGRNLPERTSRMEISLDNGATWFPPSSCLEYNNVEHFYNFPITGQGFPIGIRHVSPQNSDDYGKLKFTVNPIRDLDLILCSYEASEIHSDELLSQISERYNVNVNLHWNYDDANMGINPIMDEISNPAGQGIFGSIYDENGCSFSVVRVVFRVLPDELCEDRPVVGAICDLSLPNVITPFNVNGINDEFHILLTGDCSYTLTSLDLYDRWGNQIIAASTNWEDVQSIIKTANLAPGLFLYRIEYNVMDGNQNIISIKKFSGGLHIIR